MENVQKEVNKMWVLFHYTSGANPYIAFSEKEAERVIKRWERNGAKVEKVKDDFYVIDDKEIEQKRLLFF